MHESLPIVHGPVHTFAYMKKSLITTLIAAIALLSSAAEKQPRDITGWSHFAWGAEIGGAADLTSNDMSTVNLDAYFGYRNSWIETIGIGAEVNMMLSNSVRAFPVYAMFRTSFSKRPQLLFMDLRAGVVFNNISTSSQQTSAYVSPGIGVNLAGGSTFQSYITLSYVYNGIDPFTLGDERCDIKGLSMACIRLGIRF